MYDFYKTLGMPGDLGHFSEVVEALEFLSSLEIFLFDFYKTPGMPGDLGHFPEVLEALECLSSL